MQSGFHPLDENEGRMQAIPNGFHEISNDSPAIPQLMQEVKKNKGTPMAWSDIPVEGLKSLGGSLASIGQGSLIGLGKGGQYLASKTSPNAPQIDIEKTFSFLGPKNKNEFQQLLTWLGQYLPYSILGAPTALGQIGAGATYGALTYQPGDKNLVLPNNRIGSMVENALINLIGHGTLSGINKLIGTKNVLPYSVGHNNMGMARQVANYGAVPATFSSHAPEFYKYQPTIPDFTKPETNLSDNTHQSIVNKLSGGNDIDDAAKEIAQRLNSNFTAKDQFHSGEYEKFLNKPTKNISYFTEEPFKIRETRIENNNYQKNFEDEKIPDSNIKLLHENFIDNPIVDTAQPLQSELGKEIGYLKKQHSEQKLDSSGKNLLNKYVKMRSTLKNDMRNTFKELDPKYAEEYDKLTSNWEKEIVPYYADKDIRDMAKGNIKNPTISSINASFKNPEENISKVASDLGEEGRNRLAFIGMGKTLKELTPQKLVTSQDLLKKKGFSYYLNPEHNQHISLLNDQLNHEQEIRSYNEQQRQLKNELEELRIKSEQKRLKETSLEERNLKSARDEAERRLELHRKEAQEKIDIRKKQEEEKINAIRELQQKKIEKRNKILGGVLGLGMGHVLGGGLEDIVGTILGTNLGDYIANRFGNKLTQIPDSLRVPKRLPYRNSLLEIPSISTLHGLRQVAINKNK